MSTNINISVGDNKLLAQASLQQNASRQAQLEKEANQRLEAQATDSRTKALASQGLDANGDPLTGISSQAPQLERRPAANRQNVEAGVSMAWRSISQTTTASITYKNSDKTLCSVPAINTGFGLIQNNIKVFSANGSTKIDEQIAPLGALSQNFNPPDNSVLGNIQNYYTSLGWDYGPLYSYLVSPSNGLEVPGQFNFPTSQLVSTKELLLPVAPNLAVLYSYSLQQSALQFISQQTFRDCNTLSTTKHYWGATSPQYEEMETEYCFLVSKTALKPITAPLALNAAVKASLPTYTFTPVNRFISVNEFYNGERVLGNSLPIASWTWTITPAVNPTIFDGATLKYTATSPVNVSNNVLATTAGIYKTMVADQSTDYTLYENKAKQITNKNTNTGFVAGQNASQLYDNSSVFLHEAAAGESRTIANKLALSATRLPADVSMSMYIGYDWCDSSFCRQQLIKLGFSPEDLTP